MDHVCNIAQKYSQIESVRNLVQEGIFVGPDCEKSMNESENLKWVSFIGVGEKYLGNYVFR